jgi:RNA polymerase sigma-70 factor (ECF subfamily)
MIGRDDDQSLVEACRAGDTQAFGVLVRRYQDRLFPTVLRLTGRTEDAYDLLQEAFLRAYQKLGHFQGQSSFYTWIYRIAVNMALSGRRKRRLVVDPQSVQRLDPADPSLQSDPTLRLERAERDAQVLKALNGLAADHRAVLVLKDMDGLRYEEIAAVLGIPIGTVRSRLHRARGELRDRLRGLVEELPCSAADASKL